MENEFPGISQKGVKPPITGAPPEKKVQPIVTGGVIRRKTPLWKRFKETFTGDDTKSVGSYVLFDVLIPAAKEALADAVTTGVERKLFGEARSRGRRGFSGGSIFGNAAYNTFTRYGGGTMTPSTLRPDPRQTAVLPNRGRVPYSAYEEIILPSRVEATAVLDQMFEIISMYEVVTMADLFEMCNIVGEFPTVSLGWTDLSGADVQRIAVDGQVGYLLNLPRPQAI